MIELEHVDAGYRGEAVVRGVSLQFRPGEVTVLLGANGCGKSTLDVYKRQWKNFWTASERRTQ